MKSIFISSTFRDMQAERDVLHQQVFPALRKRLAAWGEDVQELDLRWGVDTSRMSEEKSGEYVIASCIDSIDRCKPYMVVLLGNRYGWVPEQKTIEAADERVRRWYESGSSITQLEIRYGALRAEIEEDRCIFCFRNEDFPQQVPESRRGIYTCESERHAEKLQALKSQIRSREGARVLDYTASWDAERQAPGGLDAFARELTEALWQLLSADLDTNKAQASPEEQIFRDAQLTARQYLGSYVSRKMDREDGPYALMGRTAFWFSGEGGSGKSAMLAKIADNGRKVGVNVFLYYGGNAGCRSANTLARTLIWWFNRLDANEPPMPMDDYLEKNILVLDKLLRRERSCHFAILVDGVDQMENETRKFLCWLSRRLIPEDQELQFKYWHGLSVSSTADYAEKWEKELADCFSVKKLGPLLHSELDAIVQSHSARRGKKLDEQVMRRVRAKEKSRNPYYLSLLLQKLFMMNQADFEKAEALAPGMAGLSRFMCLEMDATPDTVEEMTIALLQEACDKLGAGAGQWRDSCGEMADPMEVLALLAASRAGMTIQQLTCALKLMGKTFPTMFLERLFSYLYDAFSESDKGVWDFKHRLLRQSLIRHQGQERYRYHCTVLLALSQIADGKPDEQMYYAWKAQNVREGLEILHSKRKRISLHIKSMLEMLDSEDGIGYLSQLLRQTNSYSCSWMLMDMNLRIDPLLKNGKGSAAVLAAAEPTTDSIPAHRFYYHLLKQKLHFWDLETAVFCDSWKQMLASVPQDEDPGHMSKIELFSHCQEILGQKRYWELWEDVLAFLQSFRPETYMKRRADATLEWAKRMVEFKAGVDAGDRLREAKALQSAKAYLNELDSQGMNCGVVVDSWRVLLAEETLEKKCYQDIFDLLKERIPYLEHQYSLYGDARTGERLIRALTCFAGALQEETAVKYYRKALSVCRRALNDYPGSFLQYLSCQAGIRLWQALEKVDADEAHKQLETVIPALDKLVETAGAEKLPVNVMQDFLDQRFRRVYRRRTTAYLAAKDAGKMSMDDFTAMLLNNFQTPRKVETKIKPWKFMAEQEADFAYLNTHYPTLEKRCTSYSVYVDMAYAKMEEVRFYDACHQEKKMIAACNEMLKMATFLSERKSSAMQWYGLGFRLELAELLYRRYYRDAAAGLTDKIFQMMRSFDTGWIAQTKRGAEYDRRIVRCYLMQARVKMRSEDKLQEAFAHTYHTINKLNGQDGEPAMDKSCNDLRFETWVLMGQVLQKMGRPYAEIMSRGDKYMPESQIEGTLSRGGHSGLLQLLRYCESLSARAREENKPELMDQSVGYLCRMAREHTDGGNGYLWEQLYDELLDASVFYWKHRDTVGVPRDLMECMITALTNKAGAAELSRTEQLLLATYGLQVQDAGVCAGKALPDDGVTQRVLEQTQALGLSNGPGRLRARLAMSSILRGDCEGAVEMTQQMADLKTVEDMRVQLLLSMLAAGLWTDAPPKEPRLPQIRAWLKTSTAEHEPFIAAYAEAAGAVLDSRFADAEGLSTALRGVKLVKARMESLDKAAGQTALPAWAAQLCLRVMDARAQDPESVADEAYLEALMLGNEGLSERYKRETDPQKKAAILEQLAGVTIAAARLHRRMGDARRAIAYGLGALRQALTVGKTATAPLLALAMEAYRLVRDWLLPESEPNSTHVLDIIGRCADLYEGLYDLEGDPAHLEQLLREMDTLRTLLPRVKEKSESWNAEKLLDTYHIDRAVCLRLARDRNTAEAQMRYLRVVREQASRMNENRQSDLENILGELRTLDALTPEAEEGLVDLVEEISATLRGMPDDLVYLMTQAVQELGSGAELPQVEAYIARRRAEIQAAEHSGGKKGQA